MPAPPNTGPSPSPSPGGPNIGEEEACRQRKFRSEEVGGILQARVFAVFVGEDCIGPADAPFDGQVGVVPEDAAVVRRGVVVADLVDHFGVRLEGDEAVGEAGGDEDLLPVVGVEEDGDVAAEGGGGAADVDHDVEALPRTTRTSLSWAKGGAGSAGRGRSTCGLEIEWLSWTNSSVDAVVGEGLAC